MTRICRIKSRVFSPRPVTNVSMHWIWGKNDAQVLAAAQRLALTLISRDNGFSNLLRFPLGAHWGIIVVRSPSEMKIQTVASEIVEMISRVQQEFRGRLIILEPGRIRIREPHST